MEKFLYFLVLVVLIILYTESVEEAHGSEIIIIPSDYADYSFVDREIYEDRGQMRDESFVDYERRKLLMEDDMEMNGYSVEDFSDE